MINNNFYATINELTEVYRTGKFTSESAIANIVDYDSFVDAGKKLSTMAIADITNGFFSALMNKVSLTVDTFRSYEPALADMFSGTTNGGVIEMLTHAFYNVRQAPFINLEDTAVDEYDHMIVFSKPNVDVKYYTDEVAFQLPISIADTELRAAWRSPEAMDSFIQSIMGAVANSNKLRREVGRLNTINAAIDEVVLNADSPRVTANNKPGQFIDLIAVWESAGGTTGYTKDTALKDPEFVRFAVTYINQFREWMQKPSEYYNHEGITTFTPKRDQRLKVSGIFKTAMGRALVGAYNKDFATLDGEYEVIPYWQGAGETVSLTAQGVLAGSVRLSKTAPETPGELVEYPQEIAVAAVLYDNYALGEFINLESVTSERNNMKLYTTYFYNYILRYIRNANANFVVFTLGDKYLLNN